MLKVMTAQTQRGFFLQADRGGGGSVTAKPTQAGTWETFSLLAADPGATAIQNGSSVGLRAQNGMFVSADQGGGGAVNASRPWLQSWETFVLEKAGGSSGNGLASGDSVHLRTVNGHYLCAEGDGGGEVNATRTNAASWETFKLDLRDPPAQVRLTVDVVDVYCRDTEDVTGGDELYLAGLAAPQTGEPKGIFAGYIEINDRQTLPSLRISRGSST